MVVWEHPYPWETRNSAAIFKELLFHPYKETPLCSFPLLCHMCAILGMPVTQCKACLQPAQAMIDRLCWLGQSRLSWQLPWRCRGDDPFSS